MIDLDERPPKDADICVIVLSDRNNLPVWFNIGVWYEGEWYVADFDNWDKLRMNEIYNNESIMLAVQYPDKTVPNGILLRNLRVVAPDMFVSKYAVIGNVKERTLYEH